MVISRKCLGELIGDILARADVGDDNLLGADMIAHMVVFDVNVFGAAVVFAILGQLNSGPIIAMYRCR